MSLLAYSVLVVFVVIFDIGNVSCDKYRVCAVDGRGGFKRAGKYCPLLDHPDSKVECVIGIDRLDCLRKISKGAVDFSVFTPEDLVTAINSGVDVLLTNEMRVTQETYEYEVVAVVSDDSGIKSKHDLKGKKLCHPGYGYETDWTNILANYLEVSVVPQTCDPSLTITENRISASSAYFDAACKAGPWVNDPIQDQELKNKYPNLCALCNTPGKCNTNDKYWGRRGPLYCLTDGVGDISWARLDDVHAHFGINTGSPQASAIGFSYLCRDGTSVPVNGTAKPCVWVVKPWSVIAAKSKRAAEIQQLIASLDKSRTKWEYSLFQILEKIRQEIKPIQPIKPIENYLENAPGFLSANSFTGCHPPRSVRICTTSNIANAKCGWMREAAAVYAVEPDLDCIMANNVTHCLEATQFNAVDVVMVPPDFIHAAQKNFNMTTLFYETVQEEDTYATVAVVKANSNYKSLKDLKGAKACFPKHDGIAWNTVVYELRNKSLIYSCPYDIAMMKYFNGVCAHGFQKQSEKCEYDDKDEEYGVIRCLDSGHGNIGFMSRRKFLDFFKDPKQTPVHLKQEDFRFLCENDDCKLSWATQSQAMVPANKSQTWKRDAFDVFMQLDNLFGKNYKSVTTPFTLFGIFDGRSDILFHDNTLRFRNQPVIKKSDALGRHYDKLLSNTPKCLEIKNYSSRALASGWIMLIGVILLEFFK